MELNMLENSRCYQERCEEERRERTQVFERLLFGQLEQLIASFALPPLTTMISSHLTVFTNHVLLARLKMNTLSEAPFFARKIVNAG
jgi:hypothetical protein